MDAGECEAAGAVMGGTEMRSRVGLPSSLGLAGEAGVPVPLKADGASWIYLFAVAICRAFSGEASNMAL